MSLRVTFLGTGGAVPTTRRNTSSVFCRREGDRLLRFLGEREGQLNVLRHLPDGRKLLERVARGGPDYARMTAEELGMDFEYVRHLYRALRHLGLVTEYEGSTIKANERKLKPKAETHRKHTYYIATDRGEDLLREVSD